MNTFVRNAKLTAKATAHLMNVVAPAAEMGKQQNEKKKQKKQKDFKGEMSPKVQTLLSRAP